LTADTIVETGHPMMVLSGMSKSYAGVAALTDVSIEVLPGEVHALLGENGAGKSTLINVASGTTAPDAGVISIDGVVVHHLTPARAAELGIATVHQHPAVLPDMTVAENISVAVPRRFLGDGDVSEAMRCMLDDVGFSAHLEDRVEALSVAQKHLLELAKALVGKPRLLILDEPTAPLGEESVEMLFDRVRHITASGTAVVYITHRLAEVRELADRVTVLRDGHSLGTFKVGDISDAELLSLIVGRKLESTFPPKVTVPPGELPVLTISSLSGRGFSDISIDAARGEIIGVAGIVGNGQSALLRALSGLDAFTGTVHVADRAFTVKDLRSHSAYMPADRHAEGLMMSLSVRENAAVSALRRLRSGPLLSRRREVELVSNELSSLDVKAASLDSLVSSLSGGNQQKIVLARALMAEPVLLVADEPTQGVDVGARAEIYRLLREVSARGVPVVVASSDAKELEGLCDRVLVMSRGEMVAVLEGERVTEQEILHAAMSADAHKKSLAVQGTTKGQRLLKGDYSPVAILAVLMVLLAMYLRFRNDRYLASFNLSTMMLAGAALGFIALGQTVALLIGGIDLSVGPLAGFLVVVGSFFVNDSHSVVFWLLGLFLMLLAAAALGLVNGSLIRFGKFTPVAATLTTYIALQGLSFVLRDKPGGNIAKSFTDTVQRSIGPFPIVFLIFVAVAFGLEYALRRTQWGLRLRAVGSNEESARKVGVKVQRTVLSGYVLVSLLVFAGSVVLLQQLGIGDARQGVGFTLSAITAVVLGGTSLLGGRGTFIGTLFGALLSVQVTRATTFLSLTDTWTRFFQGALLAVAALIYTLLRSKRSAVA
jgi:ribose transport system ATP-binding protein